MKKIILITTICTALLSCKSNSQEQTVETYPVVKTEAEWKAQLDEMEYYVLRQAGTESAFSGLYDKFYEEGHYVCKACEHPLFYSESKFNSGTGWPSFDEAIKGNVGYSTDNHIGYTRTEIHCNNCGGHLGHVFNDGPRETTGKRYCVNSVSLQFIPKS